MLKTTYDGNVILGGSFSGDDTATLKPDSRLRHINLLNDSHRRSEKLFPGRTRRDATLTDFR